MSNHLLMSDQTLFKDRDVFENDHIPEHIVHRDAQLREIAFAVSPGLDGMRPLGIVIRGLPGTGKTTSVRGIFSEIEETTTRLIPVHVNCQTDRTLFAVYSRIFQKIFGHIPRSPGNSISKIMDEIACALIERESVLVVCLDDANYLLPERVLNDVIYTLSRLHEGNPGARAGVILALSNIDLDFSRELDPCVYSTFLPRELFFPPYSGDEIAGILRERAIHGLYPGVVSDEQFGQIVEKTIEIGDLRVGIDLIKRAVLVAEKDGRKTVTREDIEIAFEESKFIHLTFSVRALNEEEKEILKHIAEASRDGGDLTTKIVFSIVQNQMHLIFSRFYKRVKKFDEMRLLYSMGIPGKGRTREIILRYDPEKVIKACS